MTCGFREHLSSTPKVPPFKLLLFDVCQGQSSFSRIVFSHSARFCCTPRVSQVFSNLWNQPLFPDTLHFSFLCWEVVALETRHHCANFCGLWIFRGSFPSGDCVWSSVVGYFPIASFWILQLFIYLDIKGIPLAFLRRGLSWSSIDLRLAV